MLPEPGHTVTRYQAGVTRTRTNQVSRLGYHNQDKTRSQTGFIRARTRPGLKLGSSEAAGQNYRSQTRFIRARTRLGLGLCSSEPGENQVSGWVHQNQDKTRSQAGVTRTRTKLGLRLGSSEAGQNYRSQTGFIRARTKLCLRLRLPERGHTVTRYRTMFTRTRTRLGLRLGSSEPKQDQVSDWVHKSQDKTKISDWVYQSQNKNQGFQQENQCLLFVTKGIVINCFSRSRSKNFLSKKTTNYTLLRYQQPSKKSKIQEKK